MNHEKSLTTTKGKAAEDAAIRLIVDKGLQIAERNFSCKVGEIDIVALEGETVVFIEVRSRAANTPLPPEQTVLTSKQRKIIRAASVFLAHRGFQERPVRFDVIAVERFEKEKQAVLRWYKDAFRPVDSGRRRIYRF